MTMESREDIENLKTNWFRDPTWDIENTPGFEAHRKELRQFSAESKAHWAKQVKEKCDKQASLVCPKMVHTRTSYNISQVVYEYGGCLVEGCALWDPDRYCCGMLPYKEVKITGGIDTHQY